MHKATIQYIHVGYLLIQIREVRFMDWTNLPKVRDGMEGMRFGNLSREIPMT